MTDNKINIIAGKLAGNTFHGTPEQVMLAKHGWRCMERKKNGCVWIVRWYDPIQGEVWNQGTAVKIQRDRNRQDTIERPPDGWGSVDANGF